MFTFFEMLTEFIKFMFCILLVFVFVAILGIFIYHITGWAEQDKKANEEIHDCFIQEPRTKECEYILWKYELKQANNQKQNKSNNFAKGVLIGTTTSTMSTVMRK